MAIDVQPVRTTADRNAFIELPWRLYKNDPLWVPPLRFDLKHKLDPKKNPFFLHADAEMFLARRGKDVVGRITAQIDREHLRLHKDDAGFFGFFECEDDPEIAAALLGVAEKWLKARQMKKVRGPFSWNINDEIGLLIEGFDTPPMPFMTHSPPYYMALLDKTGFRKAKDVFAWRYTTGAYSERVRKAHDDFVKLPNVRIRELDPRHFERDVRIVNEIFNDAWRDNWGFVPWTEAEVKKVAKDLKLILDTRIALIAEIDGKPAAVSVAFPNLHEAIQDLDGRIFPFGLVKLIYRIKFKGVKSARLAMLGIRKEFRNVREYAALSLALYAEMTTRGQKAGYEWGELSWTLEENGPVNTGIKLMGGKVYKKYRVYEKEIGA